MSISVETLTHRIMERYDRNRDGKIDLKTKNNHHNDKNMYYVEDMSEKVVANTHTTQYSNAPGSLFFETNFLSLSELFTAADTNNDDVTTREEVKAFLSLYDEDGDGELYDSSNPFSTSELEKLEAEYPEKDDSRTNYVEDRNDSPGSHSHIKIRDSWGIYYGRSSDYKGETHHRSATQDGAISANRQTQMNSVKQGVTSRSSAKTADPTPKQEEASSISTATANLLEDLHHAIDNVILPYIPMSSMIPTAAEFKKMSNK